MSSVHSKILETHRCDWPDEAHTEALAQAFAAQILKRARARPSAFSLLIELRGPLGAGKTTFARHLLRALGVRERIKSPTYALLEGYQVPLDAPSAPDGWALEIAHFDFYRFHEPREWEEAGFRETLAAPGLKLIEWPEKAGGWLPRPDLRMFIEVADDAHPGHDGQRRQLRLEAMTALGQALLGAGRACEAAG